jgi:hypothetical protein
MTIHNTRDYCDLGFCSLSDILKNAAFKKLHLFPLLDEAVGGADSVDSLLRRGEKEFSF